MFSQVDGLEALSNQPGAAALDILVAEPQTAKDPAELHSPKIPSYLHRNPHLINTTAVKNGTRGPLPSRYRPRERSDLHPSSQVIEPPTAHAVGIVASLRQPLAHASSGVKQADATSRTAFALAISISDPALLIVVH